MATSWLYIALVPILYTLYVWLNDAKLKRLPSEAASRSPERWTEKMFRETLERVSKVDGTSLLSDGDLPPKTGRRYIVVGGAGFLGGWIVLHLIRRGEDPRRIRVLDVRPPMRRDLCEGPAKAVDFMKVDITNAEAVDAAFQKPWPRISSGSSHEPLPELTVIHTAAVIRFFERHPDLMHSSDRVINAGTQHLLDSARRVGASTFIYTSSGSIAVIRTRFWLWPWQKQPDLFTQVVTDDSLQPKQHEEFFSNYAASKLKAERLVCAADRTPSGTGQLRTGCIRPGNGIYGSCGDLLVERMLRDKVHPTWVATVVQSFIHVENCSLAHLCYEQRLIELQQGSANPDIGGQAFCVTDAGPPPTFGDIYRAAASMSNHAVRHIFLSPTFMLGLAHLVEWYYVTQQLLSLRKSFLANLIPRITGEIIILQPSMFSLTQIHLIFDDSRARLPSEEGGLGYTGPITTLDGTCKTVIEHMKGGGQRLDRVYGDPDDAVRTVGFNVAAPQSAVAETVEKIGNGLKLDPMKAAN